MIKVAILGQVGAGKSKILSAVATAHGQADVRTTSLSGAEVLRTEFSWPDLLPDDSSLRVRVFALTGQPMHQAAEQCLLADVDAIIYVVNCAPDTISASRECLLAMTQNAAKVGLDWANTVMVMQYNRADLYPGFKPSDLDRWLGITQNNVPRHITGEQGENQGVAVNDAIAKVVAKLGQAVAEV
ncbi:hypothetical protein JIN77_00475 [Verrucomicrobiaceae bacterium R5-34]|uniref:Uncharacterized protein n=1 Tax=Oceaniferula flava TaxID=2800421 RepID=A0AAE2VCH0_9BACT|nr:ADP-ribosylation factor-like protein [Oceaniferula flavus]MBK1829187.1 hypothetical protein [Verrucomicrobiaceae bacterium R5-34]MBK1853424.1 hypothetical protein [Oceaniferula flavus]MBM1134729.1 hypothetical protein [Oceaniferula flavus]